MMRCLEEQKRRSSKTEPGSKPNLQLKMGPKNWNLDSFGPPVNNANDAHLRQ